jgi:glutamine synthetase adenylyltransferase
MHNLPDPAAAIAYSRYCTGVLAARPDERAELDATLGMPFDWRSGEAGIATALAVGDGATLAVAMRVLRRRLMVHTMIRDLCGRADLAEVCANMTRLAEVTVCAAARCTSVRWRPNTGCRAMRRARTRRWS